MPQGSQNKTVRIVIVGGGFAGVFAAKTIQKKIRRLTQSGLNVEVDLISERNYFVFQPLLPEVAAGTINAQDAVTPLRLLLKGCHIRMGEVTNINFEEQTVEIAQGSRRIPQYISYDHIVLAMGQRTTLERFEGFAEHAYDIINATDGGYIIVGDVRETQTDEFDVLLLKIDDNGDIQWKQQYGGSNADQG